MLVNLNQYPCPFCMQVPTSAGCGCFRQSWYSFTPAPILHPQSGFDFHESPAQLKKEVEDLKKRIQKLEKEIERMKPDDDVRWNNVKDED